MAIEHARRRELPELVADHLLGHQHRNVLLAVVDAEGQPDELRQDGRAPAPDPDHLVAARRARRLRLLEQIAVNERTFPNRTRHDAVLVYFFRAWRLMMMNLLVDLFRRVFLPLVGKPHGVTGCRPPEVRPSPPPCGWSTGFIDTPRLCGMRPIQRLRPALPIETFMLSGFDHALSYVDSCWGREGRARRCPDRHAMARLPPRGRAEAGVAARGEPLRRQD